MSDEATSHNLKILLVVILVLIAVGGLITVSIYTTPTPQAPTVYRTVSTDAFRLNVGNANRPFIEKWGTVALGVECRPSGAGSTSGNTVYLLKSNDAKEYRVVDRARVTPPPVTATKPLILYGLCAAEPQTAQCAPLPGPETQVVTCPTGYTGTWEQTRTYTAVPPPECHSAGPWLPAVPPPGECVAAPEGTVNLPIVCQDAAAEGDPINACAWSEQEFTLATPESLVRVCTLQPCSLESSVWQKLKSLAVEQWVEVCGKLKTHPAPVSGGECGDATGTWSQMKHVHPSDVAGYSAAVVAEAVWLEWTKPRLTEAGAEVEGLRGYRIFYGVSSGLYTQSVDINNPDQLAHTFHLLPSDTYYFSVRAYSNEGGESALSNEVSKVVP